MYKHRLLVPDDYEAICFMPQTAEELLYMSPRFTYPLTPEQISGSIINRFHPTVMIEEGTQRIVAYANLYDLQESSCWLGNVIVSSMYRGNGAADTLLDIMIHIAKESYGVKKLQLSCVNTNSRALAFYKKHGFKSYDIRISKLNHDRKVITIQMIKEIEGETYDHHD